MITSIKNKMSARIAAGAVGAALVVSGFGMALPAMAAGLTSNQIQSILSLLQSFGADQATINNVNAALNGQATTGTGTTGTSGSCPALTRDLKSGSTGSDVKALQMFLNSSVTTQVSSSGAGSPGNESTYFGPATKAAVMKFQSANNVSPVAGYVGAITRAAITAVCGSGTGSTGGTTPTPSGSGLTVSAGVQPANGLAPYNASRIPFTNFTVSASNDGDVTLNSVTVQRGGASSDSSFNGVELIDMNSGVQIGISKTLNSNHQATIGEPVVIPRGTSRTFTVAANRATAGSHGGEIASFSVVAVNTSAAVNGSLPITGASHTVNETLVVGSVSTSTSSFVPPTFTQHTQTIGDTGVRFSGLKFTANSAEDIRLYSIRWRQTGSASSADIANIMTVVNGTSYPTTVSADGKYYTSVFPGGILIPKGNSVDAYIQGDLVGSNSASRTVNFDIDKTTDTYFVGQLYGYGVGYTTTYTSQPSYDGDSFLIQGGSATTINKANEVAAQNIAVNVPNQVLGGFAANFLGEPVSVQTLKLTIATSSGFTGAGPITSISIVDSNGAVVAGPVDEAASCTSGCTVTFSDTVTFPVGRHVYTVKGKIPSGVANNSTVVVTVDPTTWSNVTGQTSGNTVSLSGNSSFALNTMTVKSATTSVTASSQPAAQTVVGGVQNYLFANIQLDASQSGEDVRFSTIPVRYSGATPSHLSGCQIWDGTTALNNGSRVVNSLTSGADNTFTLDNSLVVPKGTIKTLGVTCNVSSSATSGTHQFGVNSAGSWTATGVTSGVSITPTVTTSNSGLMTIATGGKGSMTVTVDSSSPSYGLVSAGTSGVTVGVYKIHATSEAINLTKLGLQLTNSGNSLSTGNGGSTNNGANDVTLVSIYNGSQLVGTAQFTGSNTTATSSLTIPVPLAKDQDTYLTVKADLAAIGVSANGGIGDVVKVDPLNAEGSGAASGSTIQSGATTGVAGLQMFKSFPTVAAGPAAPSNPNGTAQVLKNFSVKADGAGSIGLYQLQVALATTSASVRNLKLFAYTGGYGTNPANVSGTTGGQFGGTALLDLGVDVANPVVSFIQTTPLSVAAGQTVYFQVKGDVTPSSNTATTWTVNVTVNGDSATSSAQVAGYNANTATAVGETQINSTMKAATTTSNSNFVWSDNATTTASINDIDWFNGYYVPGLPSSGF